MSAIELNEKEIAILVRALESYLPDLTTERVGTDNKEWHAELKEQEAVLANILRRLKGGSPEPGAGHTETRNQDQGRARL